MRPDTGHQMQISQAPATNTSCVLRSGQPRSPTPFMPQVDDFKIRGLSLAFRSGMIGHSHPSSQVSIRALINYLIVQRAANLCRVKANHTDHAESESQSWPEVRKLLPAQRPPPFGDYLALEICPAPSSRCRKPVNQGQAVPHASSLSGHTSPKPTRDPDTAASPRPRVSGLMGLWVLEVKGVACLGPIPASTHNSKPEAPDKASCPGATGPSLALSTTSLVCHMGPGTELHAQGSPCLATGPT